MKGQFLTVVVAAVLAGCGGGASGNTESGAENQSVGGLVPASYSADRCGSGLSVSAVGDYLVSGSSLSVKVVTSGDGIWLDVVGTSNKVCITGNLVRLTISDASHDIYVSGGVSSIEIAGSSHDVYVWGDVSSVEVAGSSHSVYAKSVGALNDSSTSSDVESIDNFLE